MRWRRQLPAHLGRTAGREALHEWFQRETVKAASVYTLSNMQTLTERYVRVHGARVGQMPTTGAGGDAARSPAPAAFSHKWQLARPKGAGQVV